MPAEQDTASFTPLTNGAQAGFHGVMRRVGLQEILQLECLGKKSSVLEVTTPKIRGRIYILEGAIVHAESGTMEGELALYGILGLRGGQFALLGYSEPARQSISGQWEFLLMEAARISDEAPAQASSAEQELLAANETAAGTNNVGGTAPVAAAPVLPARTEEIVLCSGSGELLFEMNCAAREDRRALLKYLHEQVEELAGFAQTGAFDRLQVQLDGERFLFQVLADRRLLVRTSACAEYEETT